MQFFLAYLGAPWSTVTGISSIGIATGLFFTCTTLVYSVRQFRAKTPSGSAIALTLYLVFVICWAALTAVSRLRFGLDYASISRYETPVLIAWAVLLVIAAPRFQALISRGWALLALGPAAVVALLLSIQIHTLEDTRASKFSDDFASLALSLGIPDAEATYTVMWDPTSGVTRATQARAAGVTIFASQPWATLPEILNQQAPPTDELPCTGTISDVAGVSETDWRKLKGQVVTPLELGDEHGIVAFQTSTGQIVGFAVINPAPLDRATPPAETVSLTQVRSQEFPFVGFLATGSSLDDLTVVDDDFHCIAPLTLTSPSGVG